MVAIASLIIGLIIGGGMFFKAFDLVDYAYKEDYKKSLAELEVKKEVLDKLPKFYKYLYDNDIEIRYGLFSDIKLPFIAIQKDDAQAADNGSGAYDTRCFVRKDNHETVIRLDKSKTIGLTMPKD